MKQFASWLAAAGAVVGTLVVLAGPSTAGAEPVAQLPTLKLALTGKTIAVSGSEVSGAVNVVSSSTAADAEPTLLRLNPGATFAQAFGAAAKAHGDPNALRPYGAILFSADAPHGTSATQTVLPAGNYVALDTEADNPAKWPHVSFTIKRASHEATLPKPAATVKTIDFAFRGASRLHDGTAVRFENAGYVVHMIFGVRVKSAAAAKRVSLALRAGKDNLAQKLAKGFVNFAGALSSGAVQQEVLKTTPGIYVLVCFMDTQDGREHTRLGMLKTIRVVK